MRLSFVVALVLAKGGKAQVEACPIDCQYETTCRLGDVNTQGLPFDPETGDIILAPSSLNMDGWTCDCPEGLTGLRCGRKFTSCNADESQGC